MGEDPSVYLKGVASVHTSPVCNALVPIIQFQLGSSSRIVYEYLGAQAGSGGRLLVIVMLSLCGIPAWGLVMCYLLAIGDSFGIAPLWSTDPREDIFKDRERYVLLLRVK